MKFLTGLLIAIIGGTIATVAGVLIVREIVKNKEPEGVKPEETRVKEIVLDWVDAWQDKDFYRQMGHCTSDFFYTDNTGTYYRREEYELRKKQLWDRYKTIRVSVDGLEVFREKEGFRVEYTQTYQGTAYEGAGASYFSKGKEVLYLRRYGDRWMIYEEYFQKF